MGVVGVYGCGMISIAIFLAIRQFGLWEGVGILAAICAAWAMLVWSFSRSAEVLVQYQMRKLNKNN